MLEKALTPTADPGATCDGCCNIAPATGVNDPDVEVVVVVLPFKVGIDDDNLPPTLLDAAS